MTLAVSLHAATDAERDALIPLNRRYPIAEVLDAAAEFAGAKGRRVTFEYACIAGVNDSPAQAEALGRLLGAFPGVGGSPREPHPAQRHRRLRRRRAPATPAAGLRRPARGPTGSPRRCGGTGAPTSRPRAASCAPGWRCLTTARAIGNNGTVNQLKWVNQFQPQTLYIATILCYIDAVFGFIFPASRTSLLAASPWSCCWRPAASASPTRRSGATRSRLRAPSLQLLMLFAVVGIVGLHVDRDHQPAVRRRPRRALLHPMSREYQRIWFK